MFTAQILLPGFGEDAAGCSREEVTGADRCRPRAGGVSRLLLVTGLEGCDRRVRELGEEVPLGDRRAGDGALWAGDDDRNDATLVPAEAGDLAGDVLACDPSLVATISHKMNGGCYGHVKKHENASH